MELLLKQTAFNGRVVHSPFNYEKFNLVTIKQLATGEEYPYETLELKHDGDNNDQRGYYQFLKDTGSLCRRKGNLVRKEDRGHVFENTANGCLDSLVLNPKQTGELRLVTNFRANLGQNLTILFYGEFENLLKISENRVVTYDEYQ